MGAGHGAWCVGCCWALMASLFALGVMSIAWMAFVAGADRSREDAAVAPRRRPTARRRSCSRSASLLLAAPDAIPGLTITGHDATMQMRDMRP